MAKTLLFFVLFMAFFWCSSFEALEIIKEGKNEYHFPVGPNDILCGKYLIRGRLKTLKNGYDAMIFFAGTNREFEMTTRGVPAKISLVLEGDSVEIEGAVEKEKKIDIKFIIYSKFKRIVTNSEALNHPLVLLEKNKCKDPNAK